MFCPETGLPVGDAPAALEFPHFPTRHQAVIWRNWGLVTPERLARVLKTTPAEVSALARRMGCGEPASEETQRLWLKRGYITLIRQNWHTLPYPQLLELLGWEPAQLAYALKEDDFLWNKLGRRKPSLAPVVYSPLTASQEQRTDAMKATLDAQLGAAQGPPEQRPFDFLKTLAKPPADSRAPRTGGPFGLRLAYSYAAVYGDPLLDPDLDPFPDGLLARLAENGVNAVWLQGVLYTLVPWFGDTPLSAGHETRIANLNALTEKAARFGVGVYLYLNEPRGMAADFFDAYHPDWKGPYYPPTEFHAMCVSVPGLLEALRDGVADLFRKAPGLAGVFTITMSENLTHCRSKTAHIEPCPRCGERSPAEVVADVNNAVAEGVHSAKPEAQVVAWNWGWTWSMERAERVVELLRPDVTVMATSETRLPTEAMGVVGQVSDYTMSKVGPGPVADSLWRAATDRGLKTMAKVQLNNTWECSAVPYLPVPFLVKRHLRNIEERSVSGLMVSWTLGGYPGGNMALVTAEPEDLAVEWFGEDAAPGVIEAWKAFGDAFEAFPLNGTSCLYTGPQNYGPMNLLFAEPTGRGATMVGFPYDSLAGWRGKHFPEEVFEEQFRKLSEGWARGVEILKGLADAVPPDKRERYDDLMNVAEAAWCHFRTTHLQICFIRLRDGGRAERSPGELQAVLDEEIELAKRLLAVVRRDSRIGFEATNHYYYTENTLKEKILNCLDLKARMPRPPEAPEGREGNSLG